MSWSVTALADHVGGEVKGDPTFGVDALRSLDEASSNGISPLFRKRYLSNAKAVPGAVLCAGPLADLALAAGVKAVLVHSTPVIALAALIDLFYPPGPTTATIDNTAVIHATAKIHETVSVGPCAVIERDVSVGENSIIGPGAVICRGTEIGRRVRIGPGTVIGYEGFGFVPSPEGPIKLRQVGRVVIEDDVEIGACACVDRGTLGATVIGAGSKLDNLVQVGHNGRIGQGVLVAGQAGLAGSVTVADGALIGGNAGIADHVRVGVAAKIAAKSGVIGDIPDNAVVAGYPAMERGRWLRAVAAQTTKQKRREKR